MSNNQLLVTCPPCGQTWSAAQLPMDAALIVKVARKAACPKCGGTWKALTMASCDEAREWYCNNPQIECAAMDSKGPGAEAAAKSHDVPRKAGQPKSLKCYVLKEHP